MEKTKVTIYQAMLKAQGEFDKVVRSDEAFNYKYAPLDKVIEATRKGLSDNGLVIMQFPINQEDRVGVKTIVAHESGEIIESEYATSSYKKDPQGVGALITYLRRYAYMAVCGIAPEDDDAQSAMPVQRETKHVDGGTVSTVKQNVEAGPMCDIHGVNYIKFHSKDGSGKSWYSHKADDGSWCNMPKLPIDPTGDYK